MIAELTLSTSRMSLATGKKFAGKKPSPTRDMLVKLHSSATEWRQMVAHGASRGINAQTFTSPVRGERITSPTVFFRRGAAQTASPIIPRLTPWATFLRCSAARPKDALQLAFNISLG